MSITVELEVKNYKRTSFQIAKEPYCEKDLLNCEAYRKFYYSVGLGAPVDARVTVKSGLFSKRNYSFSFKVRGNSVTYLWLTDVLKEISTLGQCNSQSMVDGDVEYIYVFSSYKDAYAAYQKLEGYANVGAFQGQADGVHFLKIVFHPVNEKVTIPEKKTVDRAAIFEDLRNCMVSKGHRMDLPDHELFDSDQEDGMYTWLRNDVLDYKKTRGELNTKQDYGFAEQMTAVNSFYIGMLCGFLSANTDQRRWNIFNNRYFPAVDRIQESVFRKIGIISGTAENNEIMAGLVSILPEAAKYSNELETAEQIQEVCCALYRVGMVLQMNRGMH